MFFQEKSITVTPPVLLKGIHISYPQVQLGNEISLKPTKNGLSRIALKSSMKPSGQHTSEEREGGNVSRKFRENQGESMKWDYAIWPRILMLLSRDTTSCCVLWSPQSPGALGTWAFVLKSCGGAGRTEDREGEMGGNHGTKPHSRNVSTTDIVLLWKGLKSYKSQPKSPTTIWGCYVHMFQPAQLLSCSCSAAADLPRLHQSSCSLLNAAHRLGCQLLWSPWRDGSPRRPPVPWGWNTPPEVCSVVLAAAVVGGKPAMLLWVAVQHHCPCDCSQPAPDSLLSVNLKGL